MNGYSAVDARQCCVWFAVPLSSYNFVTYRDHPVDRPESGTTAKIADFYLTAHFLAHVHSVVWRIFKQSAILLNHQSTSGMRNLGSIDNYM